MRLLTHSHRNFFPKKANLNVILVIHCMPKIKIPNYQNCCLQDKNLMLPFVCDTKINKASEVWACIEGTAGSLLPFQCTFHLDMNFNNTHIRILLGVKSLELEKPQRILNCLEVLIWMGIRNRIGFSSELDSLCACFSLYQCCILISV